MLCKKGYVIKKKNIDESTLLRIKHDLIVQPYVNPEYSEIPKPFKIYTENSKKIYMPRCYGITKFGKPKKYKNMNGFPIDIEFDGKLRDYQTIAVDKCLDELKNKSGCGILALDAGLGKTSCSLFIACKLKRKTLVIVHKEFLMNQWKDRITQFIPSALIGIIQQKKIDINGKDIVIAMLQSISMIDYKMDIFNQFGTVIIDECHLIPCRVFSKALRKINSTYMLGLSATPKRKDGMDIVLYKYIGEIIYQKMRELDYKVEVKRLIYNCDDQEYCKELYTYKRINMVGMITQIVEYKPRNDIILNTAIELYNDNRKILILSDRRNHLNIIYNELKDKINNNIGYYVGGMKKDQLKDSETKQIILGTYSMASTGLDIPELDTLIFASPKSDIHQSAGRIMRKKGIHHKLIIDIVDMFSVFIGQSYKRLKFYKKNKYDITDEQLGKNEDIYVDTDILNLIL